MLLHVSVFSWVAFEGQVHAPAEETSRRSCQDEGQALFDDEADGLSHVPCFFSGSVLFG